MATPPPVDIRGLILSIIDKYKASPNSLQTGVVLRDVKQRLGGIGGPEHDLAILSIWNDLFRTGYLGWGLNIDNAEPPFFHITPTGSRALLALGRDPGNPAGYLAHVRSMGTLGPVADSYLEALGCYCNGLHKAAAVMLGAASESIVLCWTFVTPSSESSDLQVLER